MGSGISSIHVVVNYCCKRKIIKINWNWRSSRLFWHIFGIGEISIGGGCGFPSPLLFATPICSNWGKQKRCLQIFREISVVFQQDFNCSKNNAVLEPRTGQFSRTWGFEATNVLEDSTSVTYYWKNFYEVRSFFEIAWKKIFFLENLCSCVLGLERACPQ